MTFSRKSCCVDAEIAATLFFLTVPFFSFDFLLLLLGLLFYLIFIFLFVPDLLLFLPLLNFANSSVIVLHFFVNSSTLALLLLFFCRTSFFLLSLVILLIEISFLFKDAFKISFYIPWLAFSSKTFFICLIRYFFLLYLSTTVFTAASFTSHFNHGCIFAPGFNGSSNIGWCQYLK